MSLEVTTEARDGVTLVTLGGELDIYTVAGFRQDLEEVDPAARPLVIDLTDVTLLDSSGLGALVSLLNRARSARDSWSAASRSGRTPSAPRRARFAATRSVSERISLRSSTP